MSYAKKILLVKDVDLRSMKPLRIASLFLIDI